MLPFWDGALMTYLFANTHTHTLTREAVISRNMVDPRRVFCAATLFCYFGSAVSIDASGLFGFSAASHRSLIKISPAGNFTDLSSPTKYIPAVPGRIHPTFKYFYQPFVAGLSGQWRVDGYDMVPEAVVKSSTRLPRPSFCSSLVGTQVQWSVFDLFDNGGAAFGLVAGVPAANGRGNSTLITALVQSNGTVACQPLFQV